MSRIVDDSDSRHLARVQIDTSLIVEALGLPKGTEFVGAGMSLTHRGILNVIISHDDLPAVKEGKPIPDALPSFKTEADKRPFGIQLESWGLVGEVSS